jgi:hypothetical protein
MILPEKDIKGIITLKMFHLNFITEKEVMETLEFPRPKRNRQKKKYIKMLLEEMKKYDDLFPGHIEEMILKTEGELREAALD